MKIVNFRTIQIEHHSCENMFAFPTRTYVYKNIFFKPEKKITTEKKVITDVTVGKRKDSKMGEGPKGSLALSVTFHYFKKNVNK